MEPTDPILQGKYPAKTHAEKVISYLKDHGADIENAVIFIEGQRDKLNEDDDTSQPFRYQLTPSLTLKSWEDTHVLLF